jgi:hypothetical protein
MKKTLSIMVIVLAFAIGTAHAQECLHGAKESPEQAGRRADAVNAARTINNIQANQQTGSYFRHEDLVSAPWAVKMRQSPTEFTKRISLLPGTDILPGWTLMLDVGFNSYWFMIKDTTDPCGFAYVSNQTGLIYTAEPIR